MILMTETYFTGDVTGDLTGYFTGDLSEYLTGVLTGADRAPSP